MEAIDALDRKVDSINTAFIPFTSIGAHVRLNPWELKRLACLPSWLNLMLEKESIWKQNLESHARGKLQVTNHQKSKEAVDR